METQESGSRKWRKKILLLLNCVILSTGNCGGPLISRLYFLRGGSRIWFSSWLISAAWPIILLPLAAAYFLRLRAEGRATKLFFMTPKVFAATAALGLLTGLDNFLYAYGMAKLPVSTSSLLIATQLAFTAGFAFLLVKQTFTAYSVNAIVLLTMGAGVLAFGAGSDRPAGESSKEYIIGFVTTLSAAGLYGLILPAIELMYKLAKQAITYTLVLEIQTVMSFFATIFATIGMIINKDFQALSREAREFGMGEGNYYVVVIWTSILWQLFYLGVVAAGNQRFSDHRKVVGNGPNPVGNGRSDHISDHFWGSEKCSSVIPTTPCSGRKYRPQKYSVGKFCRREKLVVRSSPTT